MFPYFGSKKRIASLYPAPVYPLVIEPFAGSMAYSCYWRPEKAVGFEADERVVALWGRMLTITGDEPAPCIGTQTDDLLVKLMSYSEHALTSGTMTVTSRMVRDWESLHRRWAREAEWMIDHLTVIHDDYTAADDIEATWFIDPPYQRANRRGYRFGGSTIDFDELAAWCKSRRGQVIVCEQEGADWLPFVPLTDVATHRGSRSAEIVWFNNLPLGDDQDE